MKKLSWIFAGLLSISLLYTFMNAQAKADQTATGKFIIIRYSPIYPMGKARVIVYNGDKAEEIELSKEEAKNPSNYVVTLLTRYDSEGYELVSTTAATTGSYGVEIDCFLKKVK
jgi:hypothetical protein